MILQTTPNPRKFAWSMFISGVAVAAVLGLQYLFPDTDLSTFEATVLTGVTGVIVAMLRESSKE